MAALKHRRVTHAIAAAIRSKQELSCLQLPSTAAMMHTPVAGRFITASAPPSLSDADSCAVLCCAPPRFSDKAQYCSCTAYALL
jgi:hypothetical protein